MVLQALILAAALGAGPATPTPPDAPITRKNWTAHPKIAAIRALVEKNEEAIKAGKYKNQRRVDCELEGAGSETESIDRDAAGVIRKYVHEVGGDDSVYQAEAHYDEQGRLRFVFARRGAAPTNSSGEFRIYFGEDGKKLWTDLREKGPGYTWVKDFPERWLEKDPERAWKNPPPCE